MIDIYPSSFVDYKNAEYFVEVDYLEDSNYTLIRQKREILSSEASFIANALSAKSKSVYKKYQLTFNYISAPTPPL
jgi:hypothetical protein